MERKRRRKYNRKCSNTHISLEVIKQYLLYGAYPHGSTPSDKRSVRKRSESFKTENNVLYYVVRPKTIEGESPDPNPREDKKNLRKAIISVKDQLSLTSALHLHGNGAGSHMGTERTLSALSSKYYWVGMAATVRKVLKNCVVCLANRPAVSYHTNDPEGSTPFSQTWDTDTLLLLPKGAGTGIEEKKSELLALKEVDNGKCEVFSEGEDQFVVTNELTEPEDADSDLDFEHESAVPDKIFDSRIDFHRARRFWHKVELQIFGPFPFKRSHSKFVVAALDSYSKWPEVLALENFDEKTVSRFLLTLIARFGVMENLILLENDISAKKPLDVSGIIHNLQACAVNVSKEDSNPIDESWSKLSDSIERFVAVYTQEWPDCLELCLLPLRNTVSQLTEFTPAFLLMGREPSFPGVMLPTKQSENSEMSLSKKQIHQASDAAMSIFHECSVPDIKHVIETSFPITLEAFESQGTAPQNTLVLEGQRKSARKTKKSSRFSELDEENEKIPVEKEKRVVHSKGHIEAEVSQKSVSQDVNSLEDDEGLVEKVSLDSFYEIIHRYKLGGKFPANCPADFRNRACRAAEAFALDNGLLMYKGRGENACLKETVMTTEERLSKLSEGHIQNDEHVSQYKVMDYLNANKFYWRAMHTDARAFVAACPNCRYGERKKKRTTALKQLRWQKAAASIDEEDSDDESSSGNMTYEDLWIYLKKGATPDTLSRSALLAFRKKAKSFKIEKGTLYYYHPSHWKKNPRKVLRTEKEKQEVFKKVHLGSGDEHLGESVMRDKLRESVFWYGMLEDLRIFLADCPRCGSSEQTDSAGKTDKQESLLEEKVKLFQDYFAGKNIIPPQKCLDSLFPSKSSNENLTDEVPDSSNTSQDNVPDKVDVPSSTPRDHEESSLKSADQPESQTFTSSIEAAIPLPDEKYVVKSDLEDISEEQFTHQDSQNEDELDEMVEDEASDSTSQQATNDVEQVGAPTQLGKLPLSIPKLPKTRKRCTICFEVILGENNFKAHMYKHTGVKPFECSQCHKRFTNIKGLRLHSRKHTGHRPFLCNICGRGFPRSASLRYHIKTHERGNNAPITCDLCHRTFTTINRLVKHKGYKHPAEAPVYSCEQCGKRFTAKRSLKRHEEAHKGIRKYQCQYCKRRFFRKEYLDYHLVSHANEDPSLLENHKFRSKSKRSLPTSLKKKRFSDSLLTLTLNNPAVSDLAANQEAFGQVVEVPVPEGWSQLQREQTLVYELGPNETLVPAASGQVGGATTTMVVLEAPSVGTTAMAESGMEVRHIFLPSQDDVLRAQQQPSQHVEVQADLPPASDLDPLVPQKQEHIQHDQQHQHGFEGHSEAKIKLSPEFLESIQQHQEQQEHYHNEQRQQQQFQHHQGTFAPTVIKLTPEDIVSLQQQLPSSSLDHYQPHSQTVANSQENPKSIEILLPSSSTRILTLPPGVVEGRVTGGAGDMGDESTTVQYQVECLSGETLTEADYDAIRMLAQASLSGGAQHITPQ